MAAPQFQTPHDIKKYGIALNRFDSRNKRLRIYLERLGYSKADIYPLIGHSAYQSLNASDKEGVVYGPQEYKEAVRQAPFGLNGIFFKLHLPEMRTAKLMPSILGKDYGFQWQIEQEGKLYSAPLHRIDFTFTNQPPAIVLEKPLTMTAEDGGEITQKAGCQMLISRSYSSMDVQGAIIDGSGKPVGPLIAGYMLWGSLGARGMKALRKASRETLQSYGTDDDFAAEGKMIDAMEGLADDHGIDLMPYFNRYLQEAHEKLQQNPQDMALLSVAAHLGELRYLKPKGQHRDEAEWKRDVARRMADHQEEYRRIATDFGLSLPPLAELSDPAHPQYADYDRFAQRMDYTYAMSERAIRLVHCKEAVSNFSHLLQMPELQSMRHIQYELDEQVVERKLGLIHAMGARIRQQPEAHRTRTARAFLLFVDTLKTIQPDDLLELNFFRPDEKSVMEMLEQRLCKDETQALYHEKRRERKHATSTPEPRLVAHELVKARAEIRSPAWRRELLQGASAPALGQGNIRR